MHMIGQAAGFAQGAHMLLPRGVPPSNARRARSDGNLSPEPTLSATAELAAKGVAFLNGPIERPWGRRTAACADPSGNVWEIAEEIR